MARILVVDDESDMELLESKGYSLIVDIDGDYYKIKANKK